MSYRTAREYLLSLLPAGYWPLGEPSGVALDATGNGNHAAVTSATGITRDRPALDDRGDGAAEFTGDASNGRLTVPAGGDADNVFASGGTVGFMVDLDGAGNSNIGRIVYKAASGGWEVNTNTPGTGTVRIEFRHGFSTTTGRWYATVSTGTRYAFVLTYDRSATSNNPTAYLLNIDTGAITTLATGDGLTEAASPAGTAQADDSSVLTIGNESSGTRQMDGILDELFLLDRMLTAAQVRRWFRLVLEAEEVELEPARVYLHDGSFRRIGQLTTASSINRSYRMDSHGQASVTIAVDDPLVAETSSLQGRVLVIESAAYREPWVGKVIRRRGNRANGTVTLEAESFDAILDERVLPTGYATSGSAGAEMARVIDTVNGRNPTGIGVGDIQNHIVPIAGLAFPEWTARRALDAIGEQSGLEWWLDYMAGPENIEILFRAARSRGFNRYRQASLVDGGNCTWEDWTEEGKAAAFALTVVAGQTTVTESFTERTRHTRIVESGGGFITLQETVPVVSGGGVEGTVSGNSGTQGIGMEVHGFETVEVTVRTPVTRREVVEIREELKTRDITVQSAQALLNRRALAEKVVRVTHIDPDGWDDLRLGSVLRLVAPGAFAEGFDGPARILGVQPMEELGECDLVLQLLRDPEAD